MPHDIDVNISETERTKKNHSRTSTFTHELLPIAMFLNLCAGRNGAAAF